MASSTSSTILSFVGDIKVNVDRSDYDNVIGALPYLKVNKKELHPLSLRVGPTGYDVDTITSKSDTGRKRIKRLPTLNLSTVVLAGKRHVIASISASLIPFHSSNHLDKPVLLKFSRRNSCSCSSSHGDYFRTRLLASSDEKPEPLTSLDSNSEEEVLRYREAKSDSDFGMVSQSDEEDGVRIQVVKLGNRSRRIQCSIFINASLSTIWDLLTDYERLAEFIPGLAVSRLLEKGDKFARLFQIGEQDLALGFKFNAKAILDCYEKDLEVFSNGQRRDIEFKMVEGDFETFEGRWSIVQYDSKIQEADQAFDRLEGEGFQTLLSYEVELVPKLWLPVGLVEGRICKEIKTNLSCIRQEAKIRLSSSSQS